MDGWLKFIEHRAADRRVRLVQKWLSAGVLEDGKRMRSEVGTVQGGSISPLLVNIYLHYVFDLWVRVTLYETTGDLKALVRDLRQAPKDVQAVAAYLQSLERRDAVAAR
jgi:retron-type reverse transcriptase